MLRLWHEASPSPRALVPVPMRLPWARAWRRTTGWRRRGRSLRRLRRNGPDRPIGVQELQQVVAGTDEGRTHAEPGRSRETFRGGPWISLPARVVESAVDGAPFVSALGQQFEGSEDRQDEAGTTREVRMERGGWRAKRDYVKRAPWA